MTKRMTTPKASLIALCGLFTALAGACKQEPLCPELGECGGAKPVGSWTLSPGHASCIEDLYVQQKDPRLYGGEVPSARNPVIEPAAWDWCFLLVTNGGQKIQAKQPSFFYESGPIGRATLTYEDNGRYTLGLARTGTYYMDFPAVCMREFGAMDGRMALDEAGMPVGEPVGVCKQLEPFVKAAGIGEGSYPNVLCDTIPEDPDGCRCFFDVSETGGSSGSYQILPDGKTILHLPGTNFPQKASFCNHGDSLELTGADGAYLFGVPGLRTMNLGKSAVATDTCINGIQDGAETGVDCGGTCAAPCP
jgi:hypothetical protein